MRLNPRYCGRIIPVILLLVSTAFAEPITFRRAIEAALKHSGTMAIAMADQTKTRQSFIAAKDSYLPSVNFGSGIGYSFGIPLTIVGTAPAIFNVTTQQTLYDRSVRTAVEAAKVEWKASDLDMLDKKNAVILDTAVVYTSLDHLTSKMKILREAYTAAQRAQFISSE